MGVLNVLTDRLYQKLCKGITLLVKLLIQKQIGSIIVHLGIVSPQKWEARIRSGNRLILIVSQVAFVT